MSATVAFKITGGELTPEIQMLASETILDLKRRIEARLDVPVARQTLRFNNQVLPNDLKIDHYDFNIGHDDHHQAVTLVLVVSPLAENEKFNIHVKSLPEPPYWLDNRESIIKVKETSLVSDLKRKIEKRWELCCDNMTLYRDFTKMDGDLPLNAYYVCEGTEIDVEFGYCYQLNPDPPSDSDDSDYSD